VAPYPFNITIFRIRIQVGHTIRVKEEKVGYIGEQTHRFGRNVFKGRMVARAVVKEP
jgi:hypothetical protein